jgi:hypothetical protein
MDQDAPMTGLALLAVLPAVAIQDILGHPQADGPVERAAPAGIEVMVSPAGDNLVAEEARSLGASVRDQRLLGGEFQLEVIAQECTELACDLLGLVPGAIEAQ